MLVDHASCKNLDSNMKKNMTFVKKCKTSLAADSKEQLLNDIKKLSLEKYISELVQSILEGMLKCKNSADIAACVEILSALHQRFPDSFTPLLTYSLAKCLAPPTKQHLATLSQEQREKEEASRITRQRTYLRISVELWLAGVLRNVEDGISSLASANLEGVETQRDSVAGLVGSSSSSAKDRKKDEKEGDKDSKLAGFVYRVLKDMFSSDTEQHINLPLAASFLKNYSQTILGIIPRKQRAANQQHAEEEGGETVEEKPVTNAEEIRKDSNSVVTPMARDWIKDIMVNYYRSVEKHLVKEHKYIKKLDHRNHETLFARGELSEETKQKYEKATKAYEKLLNNTQVLADALDLEMPDLPEDEGVTKVSIVSAGAGNAFSDAKLMSRILQDTLLNSIWEDDDARKFYEVLPDLRVLVPGVFLESQSQKKAADGNEAVEVDTEKKKADEEEEEEEGEQERENEKVDVSKEKHHIEEEDIDGAEQNEAVADVSEEDAVVDPSVEDNNVSENPDKGDATDLGTNAKPTQLAQLDALLSRLPNLGNRDMIDSAAVEFCYVNSKAARKRLVKTLLNVPRQRLDLLPYYARLITILNNYFPDIGESVLAALEHEFKGLYRKKTQDLLESRVKNIRFLSELTKFRVTPPHTIFHIFKVALDDFTNQNIDVVCNLLETCGRFLLKSPETGVRMNNMLETVMRKKNVQHLDNRQSLMVENAYYQANPPDRSAVIEKTRSPMEMYIRKIIYGNLNKKSLDKALKQLRKLHWEDESIRCLLSKLFQKVWKVKYSNIHLMAILASGLSRYHSDFGMQVVDSVVEEIRVGLEQNIFKHNQRRIAVVKYLGELYNYRMIDSPLVFDTLYTIVTLGHEFGRPARERFCVIDAPNDFFRIRLCCTLLDTCGMCFDRGSSKRKLDNFLTFFQASAFTLNFMYILSKTKPPMDVDFMISDTLEMLRPQLRLFASYEEANEAVDRMLLEQLKSVQAKALYSQGADGKAQEDGFEESEASESSSDEGDEEENLEDGVKEDEEEGSLEETVNSVGDNDAEEDVVVLKKREEQVSREEEDEFEREFSKMMSESIESRKYEKKAAVLDVPIPMNLRGTQDRRTAAQEKDKVDTGKMAFTLLTKRGNRQQTKIMEVPADSILAVSTRSKQEAEREEQQQLKKLVLDYEEREEAAARQAALEERARQRGSFRGKRVLHLGGGGGQAYTSGRKQQQLNMLHFTAKICLIAMSLSKNEVCRISCAMENGCNVGGVIVTAFETSKLFFSFGKAPLSFRVERSAAVGEMTGLTQQQNGIEAAKSTSCLDFPLYTFDRNADAGLFMLVINDVDQQQLRTFAMQGGAVVRNFRPENKEEFTSLSWGEKNKGEHSTKVVALGTRMGEILLYTLSRGQPLRLEGEHSHPIVDLVFNKSGTQLYSVAEDRIVEWDIDAENKAKVSSWDVEGAQRAALNGDDTKMAIAVGQTIQLWDTSKRKLLKTLSGHVGPITKLLFLNEEDLLVSVAEGDETIRVWDIQSSKKNIQPTLLAFRPTVSIASHGTSLLAVSSHGTIGIWQDIKAGSKSKTPKPVDSTIKVVSSHSDDIVIPIFAARFVHDEDGEAVAIVRGSTSSPLFELVRYTNKNGDVVEDIVLTRQQSTNIGTAIKTKTGNTSLPPAATLHHSLVQSLHSGDHLFNACISHYKPDIIQSAVQRLPTAYVIPIVTKLLEKFRQTQGRHPRVVQWLKVVLSVHTAYLMANPDMVRRLAEVHQFLESRLSLYPKVLALRGRLDMIQGQIDARSRYDPEDETDVMFADQESDEEVDHDELLSQNDEAEDEEMMDLVGDADQDMFAAEEDEGEEVDEDVSEDDDSSEADN
ncbi:hypothetical protein EC973_007865 [Apophysomyces ossiformis]|uniref:MIF4G domain-containing protein n=1 Tax=Apophysomyces ossiformis TaxID=679940 RepID=A0A8H7EU12_9FUNG|nr:hypothetical protein EC973_007865 [Apophysomyces ossiformis]